MQGPRDVQGRRDVQGPRDRATTDAGRQAARRGGRTRAAVLASAGVLAAVVAAAGVSYAVGGVPGHPSAGPGSAGQQQPQRAAAPSSATVGDGSGPSGASAAATGRAHPTASGPASGPDAASTQPHRTANGGSGPAGTAGSGPTGTSAPGSDVVPPPVNGVFDYQIGGAYPPSSQVTIVDRDRTDDVVPGLYNICYVNGFQTQPGESGTWPSRALLRDGSGRPVEDEDWPGEYMLDTRTPASRETVAAVVRGWMSACKRAGYAAVEIDNLDTFTRTPLLTQAGNVALATLFVRDGHALGLAVGQKNTVEIAGPGRRTIGFDFAIAEECQVYRECDGYLRAYGDRVYEVEYPDEGGTANFEAACADHGARIAITYRDRDVVPRGRSGYVFRHC